MAGTVVMSTLSDGTNSTSATNPIRGSAKAWIQFSGVTATINGSFNISSVTKIATGRYTVTMTTAMANANYAVCASSSPTSTVLSYPPQLFTTEGVANWNTTAPTTTVFGLVTPAYTTSPADMIYVCAAVFSS
jgi:hypothetical protein